MQQLTPKHSRRLIHENPKSKALPLTYLCRGAHDSWQRASLHELRQLWRGSELPAVLQAMNLQRLAGWAMTKVSNKRIRVLLGYLLPAGMQIRQVGSTVEPGAHPSRRLFRCQGTWRTQSDKPHHLLFLTQKATLIPGSTDQTPRDQNSQWMAKKSNSDEGHKTTQPDWALTLEEEEI